MKRETVKRLAVNGILTALALVIYLLELLIPNLAPIPGMKLGLSNVVTVVAMFLLGPLDALAILVARIVLSAVFAGSMMSFFFSISGGMLCYLAMLSLRKLLREKQIFFAGIAAAVSHNVGQMAVALIVFQSVSVLVYLPFLMIAAVLTGCLTGLLAQFSLPALKMIYKKV